MNKVLSHEHLKCPQNKARICSQNAIIIKIFYPAVAGAQRTQKLCISIIVQGSDMVNEEPL